jgi:hypothetical protein
MENEMLGLSVQESILAAALGLVVLVVLNMNSESLMAFLVHPHF